MWWLRRPWIRHFPGLTQNQAAALAGWHPVTLWSSTMGSSCGGLRPPGQGPAGRNQGLPPGLGRGITTGLPRAKEYFAFVTELRPPSSLL